MYLIKKLDWLSPPITLYFKGESQHASISSAILSIICYILVFASAIYYALEFIKRQNPKAYFFNRYVADAGYFPVNSSSMFNFIQISDEITNEVVPFDFSVFRAVGVDEIFHDEYMNHPEKLNNTNHWIYGYCNNNSDTQGIGYLINFDYYEQSACIRKYYDKNKKKYFNTDDPEFRWPVIEKGCSNPDRTFFGIIIQRCDKSPAILRNQGPECKNEDEITAFINKVSLKYQLIDHYADMLNYDMPFTKYFYQVTSSITNGLYIINHLNFNPANMITHNGLLLDNEVQELSYFFTQNEKHTLDNSNLSSGQSLNGCLIGIYFWMQNTLQHYERNYDRFQDLLSDIGGISSIVVTIGYYLNLLIHNYIIVLDTQDLVLSRDHNNFKEEETRIKRRPTILRKANQIMRSSKKLNKHSFIEELQENSSSSSNYPKFMKEETQNIPNNNENEKKDNIYLNENKSKKKKKIKISKDINSDSKEASGKQINDNSQNSKIYNEEGVKSRNNAKGIIKNNKEINELFFKKIKINGDDFENRPLEKQNFNWFKYIWYLIRCGKNNKKIAYYEDFRAKLISEENIIQSYLDVYRLLKENNMQKINI